MYSNNFVGAFTNYKIQYFYKYNYCVEQVEQKNVIQICTSIGRW